MKLLFMCVCFVVVNGAGHNITFGPLEESKGLSAEFVQRSAHAVSCPSVRRAQTFSPCARFANLHEILRDAADTRMFQSASGTACDHGQQSSPPSPLLHWNYWARWFSHWFTPGAANRSSNTLRRVSDSLTTVTFSALLGNQNSPIFPSKDKAGAAGASLVGAPSAVMATHTAGINLLHDGMREIAVVPNTRSGLDGSHHSRQGEHRLKGLVVLGRAAPDTRED